MVGKIIPLCLLLASCGGGGDSQPAPVYFRAPAVQVQTALAKWYK